MEKVRRRSLGALALLLVAGLGCGEPIAEEQVELDAVAVTSTQTTAFVHLAVNEESWERIADRRPLVELYHVGDEEPSYSYMLTEALDERSVSIHSGFGQAEFVELRIVGENIDGVRIQGQLGQGVVVPVIHTETPGWPAVDFSAEWDDDLVFMVPTEPLPPGPTEEFDAERPPAVDDHVRDEDWQEHRDRTTGTPAVDDHVRDERWQEHRDRTTGTPAVDDHVRDERWEEHRDRTTGTPAVDDHVRDERWEEHRDRTTGTPAIDEGRQAPVDTTPPPQDTQQDPVDTTPPPQDI